MIRNKELVYKIVELFANIEVTSAEVDASLQEAGYDPEEVGAKMKAIADKALARGICCIGLKERTGNPIWKDKIIAFDKATPGSATAVIVKLRESKVIWCKESKNFIEN